MFLLVALFMVARFAIRFGVTRFVVLSMARVTRRYRIEEPQTADPAVCATGLC
jgi:hypothetical protein